MRINRKILIAVGGIALIIVSYLLLDSILFNGIKPKPINKNGFQANFFAKENIKNKTAIILIGGGQWGDYWAQEFANKQMVGLSLPYVGKENLPRLPEEIELEYFLNAIRWLKEQSEVNQNKIVVMGASRNAELALLIASTFTKDVSGVVAYAPSSVSWSNTVLPYNSDTLKASWVYNGINIPYIPMDKIKVDDSGDIKMLEYWESGLAKTDYVSKATIKVEKINGPIILFSGTDDQVWPSSLMANMIEKRIQENNFSHSFQNIKYENAGHLISNNPDFNSNYSKGTLNIDGKICEYKFGGNDNGNLKAKQDAKIKLMNFLEKI